MSEEPITIDICPDYGGCFNYGDGGASSLPDEVWSHPRSAEIRAIEKALEVWANWFDSNDPHSQSQKFAWPVFYHTGYRLAKELSEILGEGYEVKYYRRALPETSDMPEEFLSEEKPVSKYDGCGVLLFFICALIVIGGIGGALLVRAFGN